MRVEGNHITLSRRNLRVLLLKLDRAESAKTIEKDGIFVTAEDDDTHYGNRTPGAMHPLEETRL